MENTIKEFIESKLTKTLYDATKVGLDSENVAVTSTMLQALLATLFQTVAKICDAKDLEFTNDDPKADSCKKFYQGTDKRFGVGLDFVCNYVLKDKRTWFKLQGLCINENANAIKFLENKTLEDVPSDETIMVYNLFIDKLNARFSTDLFNSIKF